jgi:ferric-chelate reductase (NADPH)
MLENFLKRMLFRRASVSSIKPISPLFRLIDLEGEELRNVAWLPGQHIRVAVGTGMTLRTYTPMSWDVEKGRTQLLVFLHGDGPGCCWARGAKEGDACEFMGPSRSLTLPTSDEPLALFGDETCFGLAFALQYVLQAKGTKFFFEVSNPDESRQALQIIGIHEATLVARVTDGGGLLSVAEEMSRLASDDHQCALTGNALSIKRVKTALKEIGTKPLPVSVKPYWAPGKTGLD